MIYDMFWVDESHKPSTVVGWLERINPEPRSGGFGTNEPGSDFIFVVKE